MSEASLRPLPFPPRTLPLSSRAALRLLERLTHGTLILEGPNGFSTRFGAGEPVAHLAIRDWQVIGESLSGGDIAFAECYFDGRWTSADPARLVELFCLNRDTMERAVYGSYIGSLAHRVRHWLNRNTRAGSRRNIAAHYDLGNDFYALWLDASMTYSSGLFLPGVQTLAQAQDAKYRRIVERIRPATGAHVLEIGCGWGGFAETLLSTTRARLTGLTLSREQLDYAQARLRTGGLVDRANLRYLDYRDLEGRFDHIVSIEMFEAVGEAYWDDYFACLRKHLAPGGRAVVQTITIDDTLFERYRKGTDFIQQYVFPGGMLPSPAEFHRRAAAAGLQVTDAFAFGRDYARTLRLWREAFMARRREVVAQGFDERFLRLWEFYLAYCEGAFNARSTDVVQFELRHQGAA
ncbi:MAG: class I SAM-dependent methyltransferase [Burkholderiales bacterium]|nr:class I SAM-dependent methyltransferase [Burkholderiales bacterium]